MDMVHLLMTFMEDKKFWYGTADELRRALRLVAKRSRPSSIEPEDYEDLLLDTNWLISTSSFGLMFSKQLESLEGQGIFVKKERVCSSRRGIALWCLDCADTAVSLLGDRALKKSKACVYR